MVMKVLSKCLIFQLYVINHLKFSKKWKHSYNQQSNKPQIDDHQSLFHAKMRCQLTISDNTFIQISPCIHIHRKMLRVLTEFFFFFFPFFSLISFFVISFLLFSQQPLSIFASVLLNWKENAKKRFDSVRHVQYLCAQQAQKMWMCVREE